MCLEAAPALLDEAWLETQRGADDGQLGLGGRDDDGRRTGGRTMGG